MHIYKFTHIETERSYIGQTTRDPNQRRHTTREYHFHNALRKYGVDAFTFEVIATADSLEELNLLEEKYVEQFNSINNGFNIRQAGGNTLHSEASKERMKEAQKQAHARRRSDNGGEEKHIKHKKHVFTKPSPFKGKEKDKWKNKGTKSWKLVDGVRVWFIKEASV